jgi:DNA gyrase/topoisomerase IV subunit A
VIGDSLSSDGAVDVVTLAHYAERTYLEYALSVVKGRALASVFIANSTQRGRTRSG